MSVAITNAADAAADPGGLTLKVRVPSGTITTHAYGSGVLVKDAAGAYHADIALDESGQYLWRFEATAPDAGADQGFFEVQASLI